MRRRPPANLGRIDRRTKIPRRTAARVGGIHKSGKKKAPLLPAVLVRRKQRARAKRLVRNSQNPAVIDKRGSVRNKYIAVRSHRDSSCP